LILIDWKKRFMGSFCVAFRAARTQVAPVLNTDPNHSFVSVDFGCVTLPLWN